jgi:hypothetical protein
VVAAAALADVDVRESALAFNTASAGIRSPSPCRHSPQTTSWNGLDGGRWHLAARAVPP